MDQRIHGKKKVSGQKNHHLVVKDFEKVVFDESVARDGIARRLPTSIPDLTDCGKKARK